MAHRYAERVKETTSTVGAGAYVLAGAMAGFRAFSATPSIANGDTFDCYIEDGTNWEVGVYTWNGAALERTTVTDSSNGGAAVVWGAGEKRISNGLTANRLRQLGVGIDGIYVSAGGDILQVTPDGMTLERAGSSSVQLASHVVAIYNPGTGAGSSFGPGGLYFNDPANGGGGNVTKNGFMLGGITLTKPDADGVIATREWVDENAGGITAQGFSATEGTASVEHRPDFVGGSGTSNPDPDLPELDNNMYRLGSYGLTFNGIDVLAPSAPGTMATQEWVEANAGSGGAASPANQQAKVSRAFSKARKEPVRILVSGTSIASFDRSALLVALANLQRVYGKNKTQIVYPAMYGGDYNQTGLGHQKQVYGGAPYIRMALKPADPAVTFSGFGSKVRVVYGTELDGGNFTVSVTADGVTTSQNLSSNGAQKYENVWEFDIGRDASASVSIVCSSDWAYLERIEFVDEKPGIFFENGTMGGAGLATTMSLFGNAGAGNKPGIPIVGFNGVDAWFDRKGPTKSNLIMAQQYTNDNTAGAAPVLQRLAEVTAESDTPVVLITEMPAVGFITSEGVLAPARAELRDLIVSYGSRKNIAVIDWIAMMDFSDRAWYEAQYYIGGDNTHPMQNGYAPLHGAFADLFNVPMPLVENYMEVPGVFAPVDAYASLNDFEEPMSKGFVQTGAGVYGGPLSVIGRAMNIHRPNVDTAVFAGSNQPNLLENFAFAPGKDYAEAGNIGQVRPLTSLGQNDVFTVLLLAKSSSPIGIASLSMTDGGNNEMPRYVLLEDGTHQVAMPDVSLQNFYLPTDKPVLVYLNFTRRTSSQSFLYQLENYNMHVYGAWVVEGRFPIITPRKVQAPYLGFPTYYSAAPAGVDNVSVGQVLHPFAGSAFKEKVRALDMVVYKPLSSSFDRGYELLNKGGAGVFFKELEFENASGVSTTVPRAPGLLMTTAEDYRTQLDFAPNGQKMTLGLRVASAVVRISLFDSGFGNQYSLNEAGEWVEGSYIIFLTDFNVANMNMAFTFSLPTGPIAAALGANPRFKYDTGWGGALGVATLVSGVFPCITATVESGSGAAGANGINGTNGTNGTDGADGTTIHVGTTPPANPTPNQLWFDIS